MPIRHCLQYLQGRYFRPTPFQSRINLKAISRGDAVALVPALHAHQGAIQVFSDRVKAREKLDELLWGFNHE